MIKQGDTVAWKWVPTAGTDCLWEGTVIKLEVDYAYVQENIANEMVISDHESDIGPGYIGVSYKIMKIKTANLVVVVKKT